MRSLLPGAHGGPCPRGRQGGQSVKAAGAGRRLTEGTAALTGRFHAKEESSLCSLVQKALSGLVGSPVRLVSEDAHQTGLCLRAAGGQAPPGHVPRGLLRGRARAVG